MNFDRVLAARNSARLAEVCRVPPELMIGGAMVDEAELAWDLAQFVDPYLRGAERNDIYIAIGVGETFWAIQTLITAAVRTGLLLPRELIVGCTDLLAVYVGNDHEPYIRQLIGQMQRSTPR